MKKSMIVGFTLIALLFFSSCSASASVMSSSSSSEAISIQGDSVGVSEFMALQVDVQTGYEGDTCHNITPQAIRDSSDYRVFKYDQSCASFLLYDGQVYELGGWFGGFGVTDMKLADLNRDGHIELFFTCSWGSGIHRSQVGYFDPSIKAVTLFDYSYMNGDTMLVWQGSDLMVFSAEIQMSDFINFELRGKDLLAKIRYSDGRFQLDPVVLEQP